MSSKDVRVCHQNIYALLIEQYPCPNGWPGKDTGDVPKPLRYDVGVLPRHLKYNIDGSFKSINDVEDIIALYSDAWMVKHVMIDRVNKKYQLRKSIWKTCVNE